MTSKDFVTKGKTLITFWLTHDKEMVKLNKQVFQRDDTTDVIAFPINESFDSSKSYLGEIVINLDEVRRNTHKYNVQFPEELARVTAHAVLHLLGYRDGTDKEREQMKAVEDAVIKVLKQ